MKQLCAGLLLLSLPAFAASPTDSARFGLDLYRELGTKPGNLFLSPYSISSALAMTSAGAKGKTFAQMLATLHLPAQPHEELGKVRESLNALGEGGPVLSVANRIWAKKGTPYRPEFLSLLNKSYGAGLTPLDYQADPEAARATINSWVEKETREKIKDLLGPGTIKRETDLVLTNAIYFKGTWLEPFEKALTKEESFHLPGGKTKKAKFLHQVEHHGYCEKGDLQAVRISYAGHELAMQIYLPKPGKPLALDEKTYRACENDFMDTKVDLSFPKFRIEHSENLTALLQKLGMKLAFTPKADFTGMRHLGKDESLFIDMVVHKAFVEVDEKGTEAAAATGVTMVGASAVIERPKIVKFRADRPFLFTIEHIPTGTMLFLGKVEQP